MNDRKMLISIGSSRKDVTWQQVEISVGELYARLSNPVRSTESYAEYMSFKKPQQDALKDVGGFVGGQLGGPRRKNVNMMGRDLITLDFDNVPGWKSDDVIARVESLGCSYCVYSTRKHNPAAPRLRVVIPLDRTVTPDEYEPCARRVAAHIGISMADPTTFEVCRLMYWPSCSRDSEFIFRSADAPLISADYLLSTYDDWHDYMSWPVVPGAVSYRKLAMKAGDPLDKSGIVGAFCRTYDVLQAMETFLPGIYDPVDGDDERFTYLGGGTTGGAILYDDARFLFSHHATDPCSGRLVNAFDLVRLHKFGDSDTDCSPDAPVAKLPSYRAMCELASSDKRVQITLNREQAQQAMEEFGGIVAQAQQPQQGQQAPVAVPDPQQDPIADPNDYPDAWVEGIDRDSNGKIRNTISNALVIINGDPALRGMFAMNEFAGRGEVLGPLPWNQSPKRRLWADEDVAGMYWYMEKRWGLTSRSNIDNALSIHASQQSFNDVQNYINSLEWDGKPRLDTLFIDYLGAKDTSYTRAVCRKMFTAAVCRAMEPGCKFDTMLILAGPQGIGKSTLLDKMSRGWFNDSIRSFEGKEASELLSGVWIVEIAELDAFRKSDIARIKQFLSLRADRYRAAYGRHVKELPRCCVFFGTCNEAAFLQDPTGNRRFWPVDTMEQKPTKSVFEDLTDDEIAQIWAEAKVRWQMGEDLFLTGELDAAAKAAQEEHRETTIQEGMIREFVDRKVPVDWAKYPLDRRRDFWSGQLHNAASSDQPLVERDRVCAAEVWCELMMGNIKDCNNVESRKINAVLSQIDGLEYHRGVLRFGPYSAQRGFVRKGAVL